MSLQIIATEKQPLYFTVKLDGSLDTATYSQLETQMAALVGRHVRAVVLDLTRLSYISSMGLRVIFKAFKDLKAIDAMMVLSGMQPQIQKVFEIAKALPDDSIFASVAEADTYFDAMQHKVLDEEGK